MEQKIMQIPIEEILPNRFQPRLSFDDASLSELAESIKTHGVIQPLVVRRLKDKYEIVAGERRYRASKKAGLTSIPAILTTISDTKSAELALVENVQRKDLSAIEEARSYQTLLGQGDVNQAELAKRLGVSQSAISNKLRLLTLAPQVQDAVINNEISERHARSLLKVSDHTNQKVLLKKIITERLTVKKLEDEIRNNYKEPEEITSKIMTIEELESTTSDIKIIKEEPKEEIEMFNAPQEVKPPNKFFNFLESEEINLNVEEPVDLIEEIEMLDFEVPPKENKVVKEIEEFLKKYPNIVVNKETRDKETIIKIVIKEE